MTCFKNRNENWYSTFAMVHLHIFLRRPLFPWPSASPPPLPFCSSRNHRIADRTLIAQLGPAKEVFFSHFWWISPLHSAHTHRAHFSCCTLFIQDMNVANGMPLSHHVYHEPWSSAITSHQEIHLLTTTKTNEDVLEKNNGGKSSECRHCLIWRRVYDKLHCCAMQFSFLWIFVPAQCILIYVECGGAASTGANATFIQKNNIIQFNPRSSVGFFGAPPIVDTMHTSDDALSSPAHTRYGRLSVHCASSVLNRFSGAFYAPDEDIG